MQAGEPPAKPTVIARAGHALALALLGFACVGGASFAALLGCYAGALVLLSTALARRLLTGLDRRAAIVLALAFALPGVLAAWRARAAIAEHEAVAGLATYVADRLRLEAVPQIAPPLVGADHPQRFYVRVAARDTGAKVSVQFGAGGHDVNARPLGGGLFRVDYDPRRDGLPEPANGALQARIRVGSDEQVREMIASTPLAHPRWLTTSRDRTLAATVSTETDELIVIAAAGVRARFHVGDGPVDCAFLPDGTLAVSYRDETRLDRLDASSGATIATIELGARAGRIALSPSGSQLAVALQGRAPALVLLELQTGSVRERVPLEAAADWLAFGRDDDMLLAALRGPASLQRFRRDTHGFSADAKLALGRPAVTLARIANGAELVLATTDFSERGAAQLGNHFVQDQLLYVDTNTLRVVGRELTGRRSERQSKPGDFDRGLSPMGVAEGAGSTLLVTFAGSDELWRVQSGSAQLDSIDLVDGELHAPHGVAELADGTLLVTSPSYGAIGLIAPGTSRARVLALAASDAELYRRDRLSLQRRIGERGFYEGTRSGIACQSCHMHADSDDAAYNLGDHRLLPTLSVRGLALTAPYLRDGSYPRLADLDELAQTLYRGYLRNQAARGDTLQAFLEALPRRELPELPSDRNLAQERRGHGVFTKAGCPTCHAPPAFTNLGQLPMRTLFPDEAARLRQSSAEMLDTPSLLSVGASAPYLNDGRAKTLADLITKHNARNLHGDTRALSQRERDDLVAFLESL